MPQAQRYPLRGSSIEAAAQSRGCGRVGACVGLPFSHRIGVTAAALFRHLLRIGARSTSWDDIDAGPLRHDSTRSSPPPPDLITS
jgi:hypothetical protein